MSLDSSFRNTCDIETSLKAVHQVSDDYVAVALERCRGTTDFMSVVGSTLDPEHPPTIEEEEEELDQMDTRRGSSRGGSDLEVWFHRESTSAPLSPASGFSSELSTVRHQITYVLNQLGDLTDHVSKVSDQMAGDQMKNAALEWAVQELRRGSQQMPREVPADPGRDLIEVAQSELGTLACFQDLSEDVQTLRQELRTERVNNAKAISNLEAKSLEFQQRFATTENILTVMQRQFSRTVSQDHMGGEHESHLSTIGSLQSTIMGMHSLLEERQGQYRTELANIRSRLDVEERERTTLSNSVQRMTDDVAAVVQRFSEKLDVASVDRGARVAPIQGSIAEACWRSNAVLRQDDLSQLRAVSVSSSASSSMCTSPRTEEEGGASAKEAFAGHGGQDNESMSSPPKDLVEQDTNGVRKFGVGKGRLIVPTLRLSNVPRVSPHDPLPEELVKATAVPVNVVLPDEPVTAKAVPADVFMPQELVTAKAVPADVFVPEEPVTTKAGPAEVFVPGSTNGSFVPLPSITTAEWPSTPNLDDTRNLSPSHFAPRTDLGAWFHRVASEPSTMLASNGTQSSAEDMRVLPPTSPTLGSSLAVEAPASLESSPLAADSQRSLVPTEKNPAYSPHSGLLRMQSTPAHWTPDMSTRTSSPLASQRNHQWVSQVVGGLEVTFSGLQTRAQHLAHADVESRGWHPCLKVTRMQHHDNVQFLCEHPAVKQPIDWQHRGSVRRVFA
eukprot:CAMPEP_0194525422 /NCGR_PEP_ID=MMETSP0253-20130528/60879_1 /TAXON_ID=2966 /ORGANISM="Noctiluca scintillans" /LENGTH=727 /DNA_ID=CAMNT_0039370147 /DNA_START=95 /DNA_END=2277 /DNA_ORIENTATION=+